MDNRNQNRPKNIFLNYSAWTLLDQIKYVFSSFTLFILISLIKLAADCRKKSHIFGLFFIFFSKRYSENIELSRIHCPQCESKYFLKSNNVTHLAILKVRIFRCFAINEPRINLEDSELYRFDIFFWKHIISSQSRFFDERKSKIMGKKFQVSKNSSYSGLERYFNKLITIFTKYF